MARKEMYAEYQTI